MSSTSLSLRISRKVFAFAALPFLSVLAHPVHAQTSKLMSQQTYQIGIAGRCNTEECNGGGKVLLNTIAQQHRGFLQHHLL